MHVSIGQASLIIGVSISTLRRWEQSGYFKAAFRTKGQHRRYRISDIQSTFLGMKPKVKKRKVIAYARVSSHDQKQDLKRQINTLSKYCQKKKWNFDLIQDLGSGVNYKKRGLNKLLELICEGKVSKLVLTHKDRLLRFGSPLLFKLCEFFGTEIILLRQKKTKSFEEELVNDVLEIMTVFSARVHGRRSRQNTLKKAA